MVTKRGSLCAIVCLVTLWAAPPAGADFSDNFLYSPAASPLAGNGAWLPTGVLSSRIRVNGAPSEGINVWSDDLHSPSPDVAFANVSENGQVHFTVDIKGVQATTAPYDWWQLNLVSDTGLYIGRWTGKSDQFTSWGWTTSFLTPITSLQSQLPLVADIDFANGTIAYSYNHLPIGSDTFTNGGSGIAKIEFVSLNFPGPTETMPSEHLYFNRLAIAAVPEPGAVGLLLAGAAGLLIWRRRLGRS